MNGLPRVYMFGQRVVEMQSEAGAAGTMHSLLQQGLTSISTASEFAIDTEYL